MNRKPLTAGVWLLGLASTVSSLLNLDWGDFDPSNRSIRAFPDHMPLKRGFASITALWILASLREALIRPLLFWCD